MRLRGFDYYHDIDACTLYVKKDDVVEFEFYDQCMLSEETFIRWVAQVSVYIEAFEELCRVGSDKYVC